MRNRLIVVCAVILSGLALLHLLGARADVSVLCGMRGGDIAFLAGLAYAAAWFGAVLVVPIVAIALILDDGCVRITRWQRSRRR